MVAGPFSWFGRRSYDRTAAPQLPGRRDVWKRSPISFRSSRSSSSIRCSEGAPRSMAQPLRCGGRGSPRYSAVPQRRCSSDSCFEACCTAAPLMSRSLRRGCRFAGRAGRRGEHSGQGPPQGAVRTPSCRRSGSPGSLLRLRARLLPARGGGRGARPLRDLPGVGRRRAVLRGRPRPAVRAPVDLQGVRLRARAGRQPPGGRPGARRRRAQRRRVQLDRVRRATPPSVQPDGQRGRARDHRSGARRERRAQDRAAARRHADVRGRRRSGGQRADVRARAAPRRSQPRDGVPHARRGDARRRRRGAAGAVPAPVLGPGDLRAARGHGRHARQRGGQPVHRRARAPARHGSATC